MTPVTDYDDRPHVDAYRAATAAGDTAAAQAAATAIVETHLGFLRQYAAREFFGRLTQEQWEEYLHELVIVALERVPDYDPDRGSFPTYIRPYLQKVRWQVAAQRRPVKVSVFTQRLIALAEQLDADFRVSMGRGPSADEMAALLTDATGRRVGAVQARRVMEAPTAETVDGVDVAVPDDHPADRVADVVAALELTPLASLILDELMTAGAWTRTAAGRVSAETGVPVDVVEQAAEVLMAQLRDELA